VPKILYELIVHIIVTQSVVSGSRHNTKMNYQKGRFETSSE